VNDSASVAVQRVRNVLRANTAFSVIAGFAVAGSSAWLNRQLADTPTLAVAAIGACVLALAVAEVMALRQLSSFAASVDRSRLETVRRNVDLAAPAAIAWEVVSDHELYGRLAPNLSAVHVLSDSDHGQRRCVARSGESWTESCDVFPDDRRYEVNVDTSDYPYPLVSMAAVFRVDEIDEQHCRASAVFRYERRPTVRGALLAAGMPTAFAVIMRRITNGWAIEAQHRAARPASRTSS